ncbi:conjugative relaxase (plasmid) [Pseudomonas umsongensis]|uniref:Putative plasmid transfer protein TraC n=2 Tax=Pseudomonas TaxID=286 RepID=Q1XGM7_PSEPU|nr:MULTISPECIES: MobF family relaxase [Pseudomonas]AEV45869.1 putative plasmid transfer protein TraC [Pseudomonas sp. MC1]QFG27718.1 conjugative relaxase [Pseudomonas umsongensis]UPU95721.1 conjugative relaxase [Pseudomonas putida]BAE92149.1 putative plasmid transfer protein TraC [Pseudomonas putida]
MFNVTSIKGSNQYAAAGYYTAADDYYAKESPGEWQGIGAELLGLAGPIDQKELAKLFDGKLPNGEVMPKTFDKETGNRRMGLDLTFSAPKSVSMQALIAGDKDVVAAHDRAVTKAMEHVEKLAQARRKEHGKSMLERTGNLIIGKFRHELSRAKDPQLHTHAVVMNATRREDGKWRAIHNDDIFKIQPQIDAMYKGELAKELRELGYEIRVLDKDGNFELAHISRDQIEAFSSRAKVIEEALAKDGKTRSNATALEKQIIAMATRPRKDERDRHLVKEYWVTKARDLGIEFGGRSQLDNQEYGRRSESIHAEHNLPEGITAGQAVVQYAINHLTEREQVVGESDLRTAALRRAVGLASPSEVDDEIKRLVKQGTLIESPPTYRMATGKDGAALSPAGWRALLKEQKGWSEKEAQQYVKMAINRGSLVEAEKRYTTQRALKREKAILAIERSGRGQVAPLLSKEQVAKALESSTLSAGQYQAVEVIVSTSNRFVGIQGDAGTGKTYSVDRAVKLIESVNNAMTERSTTTDAVFRVVALAPYGNQVTALKNEGLDAHTLASFFHTKDKKLDERTIVVLDEAGVVGARQMEQLMRIIEQSGARLVQLGDTKQTEAIEAGKPFAQLQQNGMQTARIKEIQRQKNQELKIAVQHAADGNPGKSLEHVNHVEELREPGQRHQAIVRDYMSLTPQERKEVLIVAGTNKDRKQINAMTRESLGLVGNGKELPTLNRVDTTQAERRYAPSYKKGMIVQPEKDYIRAGLSRGELYTVDQALPGNVLVVKDKNGNRVEFNPRKLTKLSVYNLEKPEFSVGDLVRITRNDQKLDLTNGDRMRVVGNANGVIELASLKEKDGTPERVVALPTNRPLHLEHAYSATVHSAQGLTNDRVMISINTKSLTTSQNLWYVAISRARHEARIYTDSIAGLPAAIANRYDKTTALSLQQARERQRNESIKPRTVLDGKELERKQRSALDGAGLGKSGV